MGRVPCESRTCTCCLSCSTESNELLMPTLACFARTPTRRSTGCGRGTCRDRDCRRHGRTESRTRVGRWSQASHTPNRGPQRRDHPTCDQVLYFAVLDYFSSLLA